MLSCLAITLCIVGWGYLVFAAIQFGTSAREGEGRGWLFLALACVGAAACLFAGLILIVRLLRSLGIVAPLPEPEVAEAVLPEFGSAGGRRSAAGLADPHVAQDGDHADPAPTATLPAVSGSTDETRELTRTPPRYQGKRIAR